MGGTPRTQIHDLTDDNIDSYKPAYLNLPPWVWPGTPRPLKPPIDSQAPTNCHLKPI
jgi:hypothetical protein